MISNEAEKSDVFETDLTELMEIAKEKKGGAVIVLSRFYSIP